MAAAETTTTKSKVLQRARTRVRHTPHIFALFRPHFHQYPPFLFIPKTYRRWQFEFAKCMHLIRNDERKEAPRVFGRHVTQSISCADRERVMHLNVCDDFIFDGT